jgi:Uma2 family endonuclease
VNAMRAIDAPPVDYVEYLSWPERNLPLEFVDGRPIVSPSPTRAHQRAVTRLLRIIEPALPPGLEVLPGPLDWVLRRDPLTIRQPDLVVSNSEDASPRLEHPPLVAVEILSETSRERDLVTKRAQYARAGLSWYWLVDLDLPQIAVLQNVDGLFRDHASATGDDRLQLTEPFEVVIRPTDLID